MSRYHIGKDGTPKTCTATSPATCPFGSQGHFESMAEAQDYSEKLARDDYITRETMARIERINPNQFSAGFYEPYQITRYAVKQFKNPISYFRMPDGKFVNGAGETLDPAIEKEFSKKIQKHYEARGFIDNHEEYSIEAIHLHPEDPSQAVVQTGGQGVLDGAVFYHGKTTIIEAKGTGTKRGARLFVYTPNTNSDGSIVPPDFLPDDSMAKAQIENFRPRNIRDHTTKLKLDSHEALEYFVRGYQSKGATAILISDRNQNPSVYQFPKDKDPQEIAADLYDLGLRADVTVKLKDTPRPLSDIDRQEVASMFGKTPKTEDRLGNHGRQVRQGKPARQGQLGNRGNLASRSAGKAGKPRLLSLSRETLDASHKKWQGGYKYGGKYHKTPCWSKYTLSPEGHKKYLSGQSVQLSDFREFGLEITGSIIFAPERKT